MKILGDWKKSIYDGLSKKKQMGRILKILCINLRSFGLGGEIGLDRTTNVMLNQLLLFRRAALLGNVPLTSKEEMLQSLCSTVSVDQLSTACPQDEMSSSFSAPLAQLD
ncbi:hypothetical protein PVL29_004721 [Vitis rotundifolia]|uniref:Uncharacterized protein n=1 Tax=Vitis rotundifolia TaxID=103349 RepID=A0AA39A8Q4_VITRO|nr:hypothetical protein PVL29_004721 [Vitis rotundifolia]